MPIAIVFHAPRLRADLRQRSMTPADLVKAWMAQESRKKRYVFEPAEYQRVWQRVHRFLKGRGSMDTADRIAAVLGVPRDRYVSVVIRSK
jgi:uncharacterized lipoprotein